MYTYRFAKRAHLRVQSEKVAEKKARVLLSDIEACIFGLDGMILFAPYNSSTNRAGCRGRGISITLDVAARRSQFLGQGCSMNNHLILHSIGEVRDMWWHEGRLRLLFGQASSHYW